jgi:uncharacterized protein YhfF
MICTACSFIISRLIVASKNQLFAAAWGQVYVLYNYLFDKKMKRLKNLPRSVIEGRKTVTSEVLEHYYKSYGEYGDGGYEEGDIVEVYDLRKNLRCIIKVYPIKFGNIPEEVWRGETFSCAEGKKGTQPIITREKKGKLPFLLFCRSSPFPYKGNAPFFFPDRGSLRDHDLTLFVGQRYG